LLRGTKNLEINLNRVTRLGFALGKFNRKLFNGPSTGMRVHRTEVVIETSFKI